ncbi:MAG: tRNA guanosine(34) transglycosylase Tgt, partial [Candidatus Firestonebacteria bacterium]|nr:tRNA guanosine(34) transglycosylase Tgt [Candidatus Firestonebacteria bacterium]
MNFELLKKDSFSNARIGNLSIRNQKITTPVFMPVGTNATVKTLSSDEI